MPTDKQYRAAAEIVIAQLLSVGGLGDLSAGRLEPDAHGEIQRPHSGGAYVACWVWVPLALAAEVPE